MTSVPKPVVLAILDGWGLAPAGPGNAITAAQTPNITSFWNSYIHTQLIAHGESVGLPKSEPGNTETGHLNLGAGRIVYQDLPRINMSIADGTFSRIPNFWEPLNTWPLILPACICWVWSAAAASIPISLISLPSCVSATSSTYLKFICIFLPTVGIRLLLPP